MPSIFNFKVYRYGWLLLLAPWLAAKAAAQPAAWHRLDTLHPQMGTYFHLIVYARDTLAAGQALRQAAARLDTLNQRLSDYLPDSELNRLNATAGSGQWVRVSPDLWRVVGEARRVSRHSRGAFDISVGALSRLWRYAFRRQQPPADTAVARALATVGYRAIHTKNKGRIRLARPGLRLDLGGIAKGYAVDEAYGVLAQAGFPRALVDGGGDIYAGQAPPDSAGWRVAGPDGTVYALETEAIATSGATYHYLEKEGKKYSHIIDPRTGWGVTHEWAVTVRAPKCSKADAWASALSVVLNQSAEQQQQGLQRDSASELPVGLRLPKRLLWRTWRLPR